ncbi:ribosome biogenesis protein tsr1 [Hysterangium stoloniferum]|nr:ribosome biogenesis protein tsr1 [Hysterangium stoloniferum]
MSHHHRPTLKQQNKPFKSKHATKSATKNLAKGRVARHSQKSTILNSLTAQSRVNRRNTAKQMQLRKRQALVASTRIFNGVDAAPRVVAVIPLCPDVYAQDVVRVLSSSFDTDINVEDCPESGLWHLKAERFKTSLQFTLLLYRNLFATLDACKVADYIVFVLSATQEVDEWGDLLLRCLQAQGLPEVVTLVGPSRAQQNIQPKISQDRKLRTPILKSLLSFIRYFVPSQARVYDLEEASASDGINVIRALCEGKPSDVQWRQGRTWLLGETVEWEDQATGLLKVTGVIRGLSLSVNRLVHIPNYGDFQQLKIVSAPRPASRKGTLVSMDLEAATLAVPTSDADSLISLNDPDTMANEQTWPTDEEMRDDVRPAPKGDETELPDAHLGTTPKTVKRVPKGTSQYQAAWIVEDENDEDDEDYGLADDVEDGGQDEEMQDLDMDAPLIPQGDGMEESDRKSVVAFKDLDEEEEGKQLATWRNRGCEVENEMAFPDEVDTPQDIPARERFQRYRGLHSFRTSPWDPYENLPRDYGKIFQFEDFRRTERAIHRRAEDESESVAPGMRVTVYVKDVPQTILKERDHAAPFVMFGLLQHEHKVSVLNFTVQRNTEFSEPVKSKDPMILCAGPRRFRINPVFSQHTRGGGKGANNVHKFERFLLPGVTCVATTYAPVVFGKPPCMLLKETADPNAPQLVAMGTFLNADTTRIIAKRIVLSGHPFKVHKKTATVRYMFFNPDDVAYFAPIQLHTKHGRAGHIRESLGTHGYFKAHFDGPVNQMDTICMSLYKRVYPKWSGLHKQLPSAANPEAMEE